MWKYITVHVRPREEANMLNELGAEGWELVTLDFDKSIAVMRMFVEDEKKKAKK